MEPVRQRLGLVSRKRWLKFKKARDGPGMQEALGRVDEIDPVCMDELVPV
jgi:hypothetical protein